MKQHLPIGHSLQNGKYHIVKVLGQGGFGVTYLAQHILLGQVVVKELFLHHDCSRGQDGCSVLSRMDKYAFEHFKARFLEEARLIVKFREVEGIVKTFDFFEENNTAYFAMEYVNASSLADYIQQIRALSEVEALDYIQQVSNALAIVHQQGVLHRDIKPQNILLTRAGKIVLIDFGIARNYTEGQTAFHTTFFTPRYAAPEQMTDTDKRGAYTDIYSLGATLYYLLTATHPQTLGEISINGFIEAKTIKPSISDATNQAITTAMKLRREERFQTIQEWQNALPLLEHSKKPQIEPNFQSSPPSQKADNQVEKKSRSPKPQAAFIPPKSPISSLKSPSKAQARVFLTVIFLALFFAGFIYQAGKDNKRKVSKRESSTQTEQAYHEPNSAVEI